MPFRHKNLQKPSKNHASGMQLLVTLLCQKRRPLIHTARGPWKSCGGLPCLPNMSMRRSKVAYDSHSRIPHYVSLERIYIHIHIDIHLLIHNYIYIDVLTYYI